MKVRIELSEEYDPPYAVIYTNHVSDDIRYTVDMLGTNETPLTGQYKDKMMVIKPADVYMVRVEGGDTVIYTEKKKYYSRKRLYETLDQLRGGFMQISKQTIINLSCIKSVEAGFNGSLLLNLKNGNSDYVSRKYLPEFKKYLGL